MTNFKTLFAGLSILLSFLPTYSQDFDPEKNVSVSLRNGAVLLNVPATAHATEIFVALKPGSQGKLTVGALPPPSGIDSTGSSYWTGNVRIPVKGEGLKDPVVLVVSYMTCLEGEGGMCFPPVDKELTVKMADIPGAANTESKVPENTPAVTTTAEQVPVEPASASSLTPEVIADNADGIVSTAEPSAKADSVSNSSSASRSGLLKILILFFLGGIGASLTPCVLPMIPITMAIIGAKGANKLKGLLLGVILTQGMALTYTVLGVMAALSGSAFGKFAQQPAFLIPVSVIFTIFAISLFGAFEIKLPDSLTNKLQSSGPRKGFLGAFVMGLILGPLSAPCVGPLIGTAIVDIAANRQVFEGALKMFIFAQGMGVLFIVGGTAVAALPKSGDWMIRFKQTLGAVILAFAVWTIRLIVPEWANYSMWAVVLLLTSGVFGAFETAKGLVGHIRKGFALISFTIAILLGIRAVEFYLDIALLPSGVSAIASAESGTQENLWIEHDLETAQKKAKAENKLVLIDTFTSWCAQCKELDEKTWPDPAVSSWIQNNAIAVRIDTEKVRPDLAKPLGIAAYPTIILTDADGKELRRINGFHRPEKMLEWLKQ
ncbi:MAG: thioredoxin fold domain-containing protein [Holophagales bacterium]|jgi:thiol:disulfide interchange protein DsbD|nr:thioredoxin fold domain-containing protein [Holophagales bacterium]